MRTEADVADYALMRIANEKRKFAIELAGYVMSPMMAEAFERGIDEEWFTLVDVSAHLQAAPGRVMKVFRLTDKGWLRLCVLREMFK